MALSGREHHSSRLVVVSTIPSHRLNRIHLDNDDNGESAAGGRLSHLLQILVCIYHLLFRHSSPFIKLFLGSRKCAGHRYALLWRNPFRVR